MEIKNKLVYLLFAFITFIFFYKTFIFFQIPFPGDLLISEYAPWKYESYLGYNPGSFPNKAQYFDVIRQLIPWKILSLEQILSGNLPLWNPYNFSGSPLLANNQSAPFYPLNLVFLLPSLSFSWAIYVILQPFLSLVFTYIYSRKIGMSKTSSFFSSIAFSFSLYVSVFLEYGNFIHTILWMPLILFSIESYFRSKKNIHLLIILFSVFLSGLAGHFQIFSGVVLFSIFYILAIGYHKKVNNKLKIYLLLSIVFGILANSFNLIPMFELLSNSARITHNLENFKNNILLQVHQLILFFSPDIYGNPVTRNYLLKDSYPGNAIYLGVTAFYLAFLSLSSLRKNIYIKFYFFSVLIVLLVVTHNFLSVQALKIPFLSSNSPSNFIFISSFSIAVLAGMGFDKLLIRKFRDILIYTVIFLFLIGFFIFSHYLLNIDFIAKQFALSFLILCVSILIMFVTRLTGIYKLKYLLIVLLVFDLFYYFQKFNPFVNSELVFPESKVINYLEEKRNNFRYFGYGAASIESNFASYYKIFSTDGYDPLYPSTYGKFLNFSESGKINNLNFINRSDARISNGFGEKDIRENLNRLKVLDLLGVKYVLDRDENGTTEYSFPNDRYKKVYEENGWTIYENQKSLPRAFLTTKFDIYNTDLEFQDKFQKYPNDVIMLEKKPKLAITQKDEMGEAVINTYESNRIIITTKNNVNSLLFLSDTYYPGWKAEIDGENAEILKADYSFRAVEVPAGSHVVEFSYFPNSFVLGLFISIISLLIAFLGFNLIKK